jgi:cytokinesis protein
MIKDVANEGTFADFVERSVRNKFPEWESFVDEISGVVQAKKLNVDQLIADAKKYIDNISNVQASLDAGNLSDTSKFHPEDRVAVVVQRSMKEARRKAEQLKLFLEEMQQSYDEILGFFGEDPQDEDARRGFFAKFAEFVAEWKVRLTLSFLLTITVHVQLVKSVLTKILEITREEHLCRRHPPPQRSLHGA